MCRRFAHILVPALAMLCAVGGGLAATPSADAASVPVYCRDVVVNQRTSFIGSLTYNVDQQFCYTGNNVYSISPLKTYVNVSSAAGLLGWHYVGVQQTTPATCYPGWGHSRGYCVVYQQVKFSSDLGGWNISSWMPWVEVYLYYQGGAQCASSSNANWYNC